MSAVVKIARSPWTPRTWILDLACGCEAKLVTPRRPTRETHPCPRHPARKVYPTHPAARR